MERFVRLLSGFAATVVFPVVLLRALINQRWRQTLGERCGGGMWDEEAWGDRETIWFHGASLGEVAGIAPVLSEIRKRHPEYRTIVTTTSFSGREDVRRRRLADRSLILPFDHPLIIRRVMSKVRPKLIVIAETELWPNFLFAAKDRNIPVVVVNGRMSEYSFPQYLRLRSLFRPILLSFRRILVQTKADAERYLAIGATEDQIRVTGSTKYSNPVVVESSEQRAAYARELGIDQAAPVFVAGSVRSGEDEHVIRAYLSAKRDIPSLQMVIVPRHPERFERVARLLQSYNIQFHRRSAGSNDKHSEVVLLDTIGELQRAYAVGSFAFVGGSLVDIGGHNPLEPACARSPVLMGTFRANVKEMADELEAKGGLFVVKNEDELAYSIARLAQNPDECLARGTRAYEVWKRNSGALQSVVPELEGFLVLAESKVSAAA